MISYSQNLEDVILSRVFAGITDGFYIDLGAADPVEDSVTKYFYDLGWSGINIEPNPEYYDKLVAGRSRDLNLNFGVGKRTEILNFYCIPRSGLSTFDEQLGARYLLEFPDCQVSPVEIKNINNILKETIGRSPQEIHFLKIDIEGKEGEVISAIDFKTFSPWVMIIESTQPRTQIPTHEEWEDTLFNNQYIFAYADGLNRFYVRGDKTHLIGNFKYPPNIFDEYIRHSEIVILQEKNKISSEKDAILNSRSWKLTKPLRRILDLFELIK